MDETGQPAEQVESLQPSSDVTGNIACRSCGYNLRGVDRDSDCPECGTSVEWSLRGYQLRFADARWLRRLHIGTSWLFFSMSVFLFGGGIFFLIGLGSQATSPTGPMAAIEFVAYLWVLTFLTSYSIGAWYLTTREPGATESMSAALVRRFARYVTLLSINGLVIGLTQLKFGSELMIAELQVLFWVFAVPSHLTVVHRLGRIASRAPSQGDPAACRVYQWLIGSIFAFVCVQAIVNRNISGAMPDPVCCMGVLIIFGGLILGSWFFGIVAGVRGYIERAQAGENESDRNERWTTRGNPSL